MMPMTLHLLIFIDVLIIVETTQPLKNTGSIMTLNVISLLAHPPSSPGIQVIFQLDIISTTIQLVMVQTAELNSQNIHMNTFKAHIFQFVLVEIAQKKLETLNTAMSAKCYSN